MITHIATQAVYVQDQDKAFQFWTDIGFQVKADRSMGPAGRWLEVAPSNAQSHLVLYPKALMKDWQEKKPSIVFQCDDIEKTYQELKAKGVTFQGEPQKMHWGTYAIFEDLDGNQFLIKG